MKWLAENWERVAFRIVGAAVFAFSLQRLLAGEEAAFATLFGVAFFCFFYANISRFKRFKGLGFEAEFWEDKQKEAADLIDRLKAIVGIYSKELLVAKAMTGRWSSGGRWKEIWRLYDEISKQHSLLGAKIDFGSTKRALDNLFLFDLILPQYEKLRLLVFHAQGDVSKKISEEFGSPIKDSKAYADRLAQKGEIDWAVASEPIELANKRILAQSVLKWFAESQSQLRERFAVQISAPDGVIEAIEKLAVIENQKEVEITDDLISLSDRRE